MLIRARSDVVRPTLHQMVRRRGKILKLGPSYWLSLGDNGHSNKDVFGSFLARACRSSSGVTIFLSGYCLMNVHLIHYIELLISVLYYVLLLSYLEDRASVC